MGIDCLVTPRRAIGTEADAVAPDRGGRQSAAAFDVPDELSSS